MQHSSAEEFLGSVNQRRGTYRIIRDEGCTEDVVWKIVCYDGLNVVDLTIKDCNFEGSLKIESEAVLNICFDNVVVKGTTIINVPKGTLTITNKTQLQSFRYINSDCKSISLSDSVFNKHTFFEISATEQIVISNVTCNNQLDKMQFGKSDPGSVCSIKKLIIQDSPNGFFAFYNCRFENWNLFQNISVDRLEFNRCIFETDFQVYNLILKNYIHFDGCCFHKKFICLINKLPDSKTTIRITPTTTFGDTATFDRSNVDTFYLEGAHFEKNCSFAQVIGQKISIINPIFKSSCYFMDTQFNEADRNTFRIIKNELIKTRNDVDAAWYYSKEQKEIYNNLTWDTPGKKIQFFANYISNDFGISWTRGLAFTILSSVFLYIIYLFTLNEPICCVVKLNNFFKFFIITHDLDFMKSYGPDFGSYLVDSFSRIVIGYGIVQTVQAFRRDLKI